MAIIQEWYKHSAFIFNGLILMISWPIAWGVYMPIALKEGGSKRLWGDACILSWITAIFFVLWPNVCIYYGGPLAASGFMTLTLPISVFLSAQATWVCSLFIKIIWVQMIPSIIVAVFISVLGAWIS